MAMTSLPALILVYCMYGRIAVGYWRNKPYVSIDVRVRLNLTVLLVIDAV